MQFTIDRTQGYRIFVRFAQSSSQHVPEESYERTSDRVERQNDEIACLGVESERWLEEKVDGQATRQDHGCQRPPATKGYGGNYNKRIVENEGGTRLPTVNGPARCCHYRNRDH